MTTTSASMPNFDDINWEEIFEHELMMEEYETCVKPFIDGTIECDDSTYMAWLVKQAIAEA